MSEFCPPYCLFDDSKELDRQVACKDCWVSRVKPVTPKPFNSKIHGEGMIIAEYNDKFIVEQKMSKGGITRAHILKKGLK
jgi:hypothetical protein